MLTAAAGRRAALVLARCAPCRGTGEALTVRSSPVSALVHQSWIGESTRAFTGSGALRDAVQAKSERSADEEEDKAGQAGECHLRRVMRTARIGKYDRLTFQRIFLALGFLSQSKGSIKVMKLLL